MEVYALQTISYGVKDGNGVKRIEYALQERIESKDGVTPSSAEIKEWVARGMATKQAPSAVEDDAGVTETDESGQKRAGAVKSSPARKTNPPKDPDVAKNPPGTNSEPEGGAQP